jgi:hypothetical protein
MAQTDELLAKVELGLDAQAFMRTKLGQYLIGRANEIVEEAVEKLKEADPDDTKAIRDLQNTIRLNESFMYWLADAVTQGQSAEELLIQQQE